MKIIKHLERILGNNGGIFKFVLIIFWIFWAAGLSKPFADGIRDGAEHQRNRNVNLEIQHGRGLVAFAEQLAKEAEKKGEAYSPKDYFGDLKKIDEKKLECYTALFDPDPQLSRMNSIVGSNIKRKLFTENEIVEAQKDYKEWRDGGKAEGEQFRETVRSSAKSRAPKNFSDFFTWLLVFYRRSIFLAIAFFLVRMAEGSGILETVLAEKRKFALAVLAWPLYFHKYPYNVVREIRVEAELRRLGKVFRKLTIQERETIRKVANSDQYFSWINAFRVKNEGRFQRGLIIALLAILCLRVVWPVTFVEASTRNGPIHCTAISMPTDQLATSQTIHNLSLKIVDSGQWCLPVGTMEVSKPKFLGRIYPLIKLLPRKILLKRIDHVPLNDYLIGSVCLIK
ncbi:MAG: hypothetical protein WC297_02140 [Candidatus Paceibacterota bacterium]